MRQLLSIAAGCSAWLTSPKWNRQPLSKSATVLACCAKHIVPKPTVKKVNKSLWAFLKIAVKRAIVEIHL
jgi:hypothetical protein